MKRIIGIILLLGVLSGCSAPATVTRPKEMPGGSQLETTIPLTPADDIKESCISCDKGTYTLTLPQSGETVELSDREVRFIPYISGELVVAAESKILAQTAEYGENSGFYLQITDDYLCLSMEIIKDLTPPEPAEDGTVLTGCGIDHDHVFYSERITTQPVMEETDRTDGESNTGVVYRSGENKTSALSALLWASYDNGDGSCTEADGMGIRGVLPGPEELREVNIPVLYTYPNGKMEAIVPVNGQITEVYLLDMTDRENYPMTEITWEEMEVLSPGEYYIVTRVLRSGNCDPGVPQNSRCYEELFCLVVQEPTQ